MQARDVVRGEAHPNTKLTDEMVLAIRSMQGHVKELAKCFNVSVSCIRQIKRNESWRHLL